MNKPALAPVGGAAPAASAFRIESHEVLPEALSRAPRKGARKSGYPFDKLNPKQSFFVATSDEDKDQDGTMKRLQSSISAARNRLNFDHVNLTKRDVRIRGGEGKTEAREMPTPLPADKHRDFRALPEVHEGVKGVRVYRTK